MYILARIVYFGPGITKGMGKEALLQRDKEEITPPCFKQALGKVTQRHPLSLPKKRQVAIIDSNLTSQFQTDHISHAAF